MLAPPPIRAAGGWTDDLAGGSGSGAGANASARGHLRRDGSRCGRLGRQVRVGVRVECGCRGDDVDDHTDGRASLPAADEHSALPQPHARRSAPAASAPSASARRWARVRGSLSHTP
ncbi:hypothetical protein AWC15_06640 [Mycobacterium lacus]|nr:hypothetical protein AWC15_06640 [Mycobacterium lacus]